MITGRILAVIFNSKETSYTIAKLDTQDGVVTICGYLPKLDDNSQYNFNGEYVSHPKYGRQFKVSTYERVSDNSREGIISYLSSDLFQGIGPVTAEAIYDTLGPNCIEKIQEDENCLKEVGLSPIKIARLYEDLVKNQGMQKVLVKLYGYGITPKMSLRLFDLYGIDAVRIIEENPYRLISEVDGYSFVKADSLAMSIGFSPTSALRIRASIFYVLDRIVRNYGYTYVTKEQLISSTFDYLNKINDIKEDLIINELHYIIENKAIVEEEDKIFLPSLYDTEVDIAKKIKDLIMYGFKKDYNPLVIDKAISHVEESINVKYSQMQKEAIKSSIISPISIITGGPGTGKTTVINGIIRVYALLNDINPSGIIGLMAPTGRASKRMYEATNVIAQTIHRSLGYDYSGEFMHDETNPLGFKMIIVDEASMIDVYLANNLLKAIERNTQVIFVGDANQLPSVGPGRVLNDLIDSKELNIIRLTEIHRQASNSNIIRLSNEVNSSNISEEIFEKQADLEFHSSTVDNISLNIISLINKEINNGYTLKDDIQVLIPMYKGISGIDQINIDIQEKFNPSKEFIKYGDKEYRVNDKVLQLQNNPNKDVMNGDIGYVKKIISAKENNQTIEYLVVDFDNLEVTYKKEELEELTLAYAISIHKSQGSEYPVVIMPITRSYMIMLKKKLIYTAITRAKKRLYIVGDKNAFIKGVSMLDDERQTTLKNRLTENKLIKLNIEGCPFEYFGEYDMENITPYTFLEKGKNN